MENDLISRSHFDERVRCAAGADADEEFSADFLDGVKTVLYMLSSEPNVPQEMSAREYGRMREQICHQYQDECWDCPFYYDKWCHFDDLDNRTIFQVEKWMKEHSERSEEEE